LLVRNCIRLRLQVHKQAKNTQLKLLGHRFVDWVQRPLSRETHDVRQETHTLLVKMRVLQSLFRLTKTIKRLRLRAIYWKQLMCLNRWTEYVRENQRLRLQLPHNTGEVVPNHGEMRQYRLLDAFFYLQTRALLGRTLSTWVSFLDAKYRRRHFGGIISLRNSQRFGATIIGRWLQHTHWYKSGISILHANFADEPQALCLAPSY